jgi:hypothetical protein
MRPSRPVLVMPTLQGIQRKKKKHLVTFVISLASFVLKNWTPNMVLTSFVTTRLCDYETT